MQNDSIIYVNFSPYENAGKILDYLLENFKLVALFSFSFHRLKNKKDSNKLKVYRRGMLIETKDLFDYQFPERLIFLFLPIRSSFIFLQIVFYSTYLRIKYGKFKYYFTVNAFTAWAGNILKNLGIVEKTIFWVWDYYPPFHESRIIALVRWTYWQFDKQGTQSDTLVFLNERLARLRKEMGELNKNTPYKIIPIGANNIATVKIPRVIKSKLNLVYMGVVKKSQGLDLVIDNADRIMEFFPKATMHIIGGGPDLEYFRTKVKHTRLRIIFHGYLSDKKRDQILKKSHIGIATYVPGKDNVAYYGDPSKIKHYLSFGLPVITTNVFDFSKEIKKEKAGIIIDYFNSEDFAKALKELTKKINFYSSNATKLAIRYYYRSLYINFFE